MKNEFVPYEEALAMKELGFDYSCFGYHIEDFGEGIGFNKKYTPSQNHHPYQSCSAPLYQQAFRWFRDVHDLDFTVINIRYKTYEEAELACLKKLIEIVKQNKDDE